MFSDRRIRTSLIAIAADLVLTLLKGGLALLTGSAALLADAYHSGTDLIVSLVLLGSLVLRYFQEKNAATQRATLNARRLESSLAIFVSLLILYVPYEILGELDERSAVTVSHLWVGIAGTLVIIGLVYFMARLKTYVGRETDSPALEADGYHSKIDLFSSIAVLLSLVGLMVGVYLDEIVAIIIAVLIGIAGIELLVSGVRSLARGDDLDPVSAFEALGQALKRLPLAPLLWSAGAKLQSGIHGARWTIAALLLAAYLLSGFSRVELGQVGVAYRLGAAVGDELAPGLHYRLPWPFGEIRQIPHGLVYATTVGSRFTALTDAPPDRLWRETTATRAHEDESAYLATGDENLVDIEFSLQYRLKDSVGVVKQVADMETLVHRYLETALWQETAGYRFDELLLESHRAFSARVAEHVVAGLRDIGVDVTVVDARVQSLQPPAMVVPVYRDRLNAAQEKEQRRNRAEAQRSHDLLMANASRLTAEAEAESEALERRLTAEGEVERFRALAEVFAQHAAAVQFNQYIETLVDTVQDKRIRIVDPAIEKDDLRVWGQTSLMGGTGRAR